MRVSAAAGLSVFLLLASPTWAQRGDRPERRADDAPSGDQAPTKKDKDAEASKAAEPVVRDHTINIGGATIDYTSTAGMLPLMDDAGKTRANVFYVAYTRKSDATDAKRPVTFAFNGGPGSSSVWLHIGALGPRRVEMGPEGEMLSPTGELTDNGESWLDMTDLVFIDPVSTGFSRAEPGVNPHDFHGLDEDVEAVGDFIRLYLTREDRWMSPKFLAGESYGTTRASALSIDLHDRLGIDVNGVVLISPVLDFQTLSFDLGNDEGYRLYLPTYAASAFFHKALKGDLALDLNTTVDAARRFADSEYLLALSKGDTLSAEERSAIANRLAELTGLSEKFIDQSNLRVSPGAFMKELLRDQSRTIGRYDSRYTGIDRTDAGFRSEYDPSYAAVQGPFTACLNQYMRVELGYESDQRYEILTGAVNPWRFGRNENRYPNVADRLRQAMTQNPNLRVMAASGYFDLATPFHAMTFTINHLGLDESMRDHIAQQYYHAGHMMYLRDEDRQKLKADAAAFYRATLGS